jgi:hypothetical protein
MREDITKSIYYCLELEYFCVISLFMVAHIAVVCYYKEYRFPIAPEPIESTWYFLYQSPLIKLMEKIKNPHKLSLKAFYPRGEALGY